MDHQGNSGAAQQRAEGGARHCEHGIGPPVAAGDEIAKVALVGARRILVPVLLGRRIQMPARCLKRWSLTLGRRVQMDAVHTGGEPGRPDPKLNAAIPLPQRNSAEIRASAGADHNVPWCRATPAAGGEEEECRGQVS